MDTALNLMNHLLPVIITLGFVILGVALCIGVPYMRHVALVTRADSDKGIEDLAKYLAHKTGGRAINVDQTWQTFIPAARSLNRFHKEKKDQLELSL